MLLVLEISLRAGNRSSFADACCPLRSQHDLHPIQCCVISGNEGDNLVCQNSLGSCWWSALFFHLCSSFRMLTLGVMPVSLHRTLIINNPLELCSFYLNNRGACLTNLYSNADSWRCEEWLKMQRSLLERFCGFQLHKPDKFLLGAPILHHSSICLCDLVDDFAFQHTGAYLTN